MPNYRLPTRSLVNNSVQYSYPSPGPGYVWDGSQWVLRSGASAIGGRADANAGSPFADPMSNPYYKPGPGYVWNGSRWVITGTEGRTFDASPPYTVGVPTGAVGGGSLVPPTYIPPLYQPVNAPRGTVTAGPIRPYGIEGAYPTAAALQAANPGLSREEAVAQFNAYPLPITGAVSAPTFDNAGGLPRYAAAAAPATTPAVPPAPRGTPVHPMGRDYLGRPRNVEFATDNSPEYFSDLFGGSAATPGGPGGTGAPPVALPVAATQPAFKLAPSLAGAGNLNNLPILNAARTNTLLPLFRAPGSGITFPEVGITGPIPSAFQLASTYQGSAPFERQQILDLLGGATGLPEASLLAQIYGATPGFRFNPQPAFRIV